MACETDTLEKKLKFQKRLFVNVCQPSVHSKIQQTFNGRIVKGHLFGKGVGHFNAGMQLHSKDVMCSNKKFSLTF